MVEAAALALECVPIPKSFMCPSTHEVMTDGDLTWWFGSALPWAAPVTLDAPLSFDTNVGEVDCTFS